MNIHSLVHDLEEALKEILFETPQSLLGMVLRTVSETGVV